MSVIQAHNLSKRYGAKIALDQISFSVPAGRIVGLIGPNGAGKTTALKAVLGLTDFLGELKVLGLNPYTQRDELMQNVCFIADVAILPRWIRVGDLVAFTQSVHPKFDRARFDALIAQTEVKPLARVRELSKGMVAQLHLSLVMAIDAKLLVLDEPTLGLDIIYRKRFYDTLLNDYFDQEKTIIVTTHQVEEIQHILTDLIFIQHGRIILDASMDQVSERFTEVLVAPARADAARALKPLNERLVFGKHVFLYDSVDRQTLAALGEINVPGVADLFVATMSERAA